jgi:hypothetical protein
MLRTKEKLKKIRPSRPPPPPPKEFNEQNISQKKEFFIDMSVMPFFFGRKFQTEQNPFFFSFFFPGMFPHDFQ